MPYDNAPMESFMGHLRQRLSIHIDFHRMRNETKQPLSDSIRKKNVGMIPIKLFLVNVVKKPAQFYMLIFSVVFCRDFKIVLEAKFMYLLRA